MSLNLAVDSGGTKVRAVLYDEFFNPIKECVVGSMRPESTSAPLVEKHIRELVDKLEIKGKTISTLVGIYEDALYDELCRVTTVENAILIEEDKLGFLSAGIFSDGYLAIAGTGSTLFCSLNGEVKRAGGYGSLIADEGSGYWIAREAFIAAIQDEEGRGKKTRLRELIAQKLGKTIEDFPSAVLSIYDQMDINPITYIASFAPLVTQAANAHDEIALNILKNAGRLLGEQLASLVKAGSPKDLPIALCGSVWKSHGILFSEFCDVIRKEGMTGEIKRTVFEPVIGAILYHFKSINNDIITSDFEAFRKKYNSFLL